jgi:predicted CXXCH cytochrome family protein
MKRFTYILGAAAICLGLAAQANAQSVTSVANSPHNLNYASIQAKGVAPVTSSGGGTTEVCLPCHTPHNGSEASLGLLWNHDVTATATSYNLYNNVFTTDNSGTTSSNPELDNTTLLCLSCHDGSIAVDNYGGNKTDNNIDIQAIGSWAKVSAADATNDLSGDHPLGIGYPGLPKETSVVAGSFTNTAGTPGAGFVDPTNAAGPFGTGGVGGIAKVKLVALPNGYMGVGCVSCHEPHDFSEKFLRSSTGNNSSAVCFGCHIK